VLAVTVGIAVGVAVGAGSGADPRTEAVNAGPVVRRKHTTDRSERADEVTSRVSGPRRGRWADAAVQDATDGNRYVRKYHGSRGFVPR
jgi:hypothetical protein